MHVTLFERAVRQLKVHDVHALAVEDPVVTDAAVFLGLVLRS
jgi:hypothetical protein